MISSIYYKLLVVTPNTHEAKHHEQLSWGLDLLGGALIQKRNIIFARSENVRM